MASLLQWLLDLIRRLMPWGGRDTPELEPVVLPPDEEPTEPKEPPMPTRPTLSKGATDTDAVRELQDLLNLNGARLTVDGDFGNGTKGAVEALQGSYGLERTGTADEAVWEILDRPPFGATAGFQDVPLAPEEEERVSGSGAVVAGWNSYGNLLWEVGAVLGLAPVVTTAVLAVESGGKGFEDGRMVIRFENHIFKKYWGNANSDKFAAHFRMNPERGWEDQEWRPSTDVAWRPLHTQLAGQDEEWDVFTFARSLDETAAMYSISMGSPQIMGFNYKKVGFSTVQAMYEAFAGSDRAHILGLFDFIRSDHRMVGDLRTEDWQGFASIYNGPGQAATYGGWISDNVAKAKAAGIPS